MEWDGKIERTILRHVDRKPNHPGGVVEIPGYSQDAVFEHIADLQERRFLDAEIVRDGSGQRLIYAASVSRITAAGREYLRRLDQQSGQAAVKAQDSHVTSGRVGRSGS